MSKPKRDLEREERIEMEIVVDCYDEYERFEGWRGYLEDALKFPFRARCVEARTISPLKKGEEVEVMGMLEDESGDPSEMFVRVQWQGRTMGMPLVQLEGMAVDAPTAQAIADWRYWCDQGYQF